MKFVESRFNINALSTDGSVMFLMNTRTGALIEIPIEMWEMLLLLFNGIYDSKLFLFKIQNEYMNEILVRGGYMVPINKNELDELESEYHMEKNTSNTLALTIATTLGCNLACEYCYAAQESRRMSNQTQADLVDFVESKIQEDNPNTLNIGWIGGEPTLEFETILKLSKRFKNLCNNYRIEYGAQIITNGTLVDEKMARLMKDECDINFIQITIDGPEHDTRRPWKDKSKRKKISCLKTIIQNYQILQKHIPNISIRMNIDKANADVPKLVEFSNYLKENQIDIKRIYLGHVHSAVRDMTYDEKILALKDFVIVQRNFNKAIGNIARSIAPKAISCGHIGKHTYDIDPDGYITKCWDNIGYENMRIGHINSGFYDYNNLEFMDYTPFEIEACRNCSLLPMCMGGCPMKALRETESTNCVAEKYYTEEWLRSLSECLSERLDSLKTCQV